MGEKAEIASKSYLSLSALSLYLQAIMSYVWYECPKQGKKATIREMMELLTEAKVAENAGDLSELDRKMNVLPDDHPAKVAYLKVRSGAKDTIRSIIISAHARLAYLQNPKILKILDHDDIDIRAIGEGVYENPDRKTALFCIIPDNDKSYSFLIGMLYTQIFQELYYIADFKYGGALPIHVAFWMDEFANTSLPDGFTEIIATMRSRNISANIILQNRAQLQALFKDTWQAIIGNADTMIYLGGNEPETHKYMTEMLGKYTLGKCLTGEVRTGWPMRVLAAAINAVASIIYCADPLFILSTYCTKYCTESQQDILNIYAWIGVIGMMGGTFAWSLIRDYLVCRKIAGKKAEKKSPGRRPNCTGQKVG